MENKLVLRLLISSVCFVFSASATEKATTVKEPQTTTAESGKKVRKKKTEMCSECGKPEHECECHGPKKSEEKK